MKNMINLNDLISIILPIYNVDSYLKKCIESVLNQTYSNIEIILVDDGSTDNSPLICDEYKKKDSRVRTIHKKNGGLSDARNCGINLSTGKYLTFIDSDDYVSEDYVEYLYNLIKKNNTKISCCGHYIVKKNKMYRKTASETKVFTKINALNAILYDEEIDLSSWGKMYEKSLFEDIKFPKGKFFEDTGTTYLLFDKCEGISVGKEIKYYYIIRNESITTKAFNKNKMDLITMTNKMVDFIELKYPELSAGCRRRIMWAYLSTYTKIVYTSKNKYLAEKKLLKSYIKKNKKEILKDNKIKKKDKIALLIFNFGDFFFKISWKFYKLLSK